MQYVYIHKLLNINVNEICKYLLTTITIYSYDPYPIYLVTNRL